MEDIKLNCEFCGDKRCLVNGVVQGDKCPKIALWKEGATIQSFLEEAVVDDPTALVERLTVINSYMARTGYLLAQAIQLQEITTANVFIAKGADIQKYPASIQKNFINAMTSDVNVIVKLFERQNRALVHQGENIRTQISFAKQDLALQRQGY